MFSALPDSVSICEVSPRDGLQNQPVIVSLDKKLELIDALVASGLKRVEATSFVSPKWIPQLADADALAKALMARAASKTVQFSALCPNEQGVDRASRAGVTEIAVFMSATESHTQKNTNRSIAEAFAIFAELVPAAMKRGMRVRAYVSTVWGCPYEGEVKPAVAIAIAKQLIDYGCYQVSLGDTIGVGTPKQTKEIVERAIGEIGAEKLALHLHDTRGTALANALVGLELGVRGFDASVGGMGGCPYAPGAAGNLATEDLVYMLHGMGISTGIDLEKLIVAGRVASRVVESALPGKVHQAGLPRVM